MDAEAKQILDRRLAAGEISPEEYRKILDELQPAGGGSRSDAALGQNEEESRASSKTQSSTIQSAPVQEQKSSSGCVWVFLLLFIGGGIFAIIESNRGSTTSSDSSYEVYEPTPLTTAQIEAAAESFYLKHRYTFRKWVKSISDGNEYDQKEAQNDLNDIMFELLASDKYADGDASKVWKQALNIATTRDN